MNQTIILTILSYTIGFFFILAIRSYDKYDKEPLGRLLLFSFVGGLVSVGVASFIYLFVHPKMNLFDAIFKVGAVEELAKLLTLVFLYRIIKNKYDEIVDGIIYMAAISLGFSVIENIFYTSSAVHPYGLLAQRTLFATLGHIAFSVYMGIAFYIHKKVKRNYSGILVAYIIAVLAHGLYDGFIFDKDLVMFFIPTYIFIIYLEFRLLKVALAYSKFKKDLAIENLSLTENKTNHYCCNCGNKNAEGYKFASNVYLSVCSTCDYAILSPKSFSNLLKYFRPKLNRKKYLKNLDNNHSSHVIKNDIIIFSKCDKRFNAKMSTLNTWLAIENKNDLEQYHKSIEGFIFKMLGFGKIKNF